MLSTGAEHRVTSAKPSPIVGMPVPQQPALQLIYDTAPIGLAVLSPDCRYLQINQRLTEICGISVEDHLGRSVRDCVPALADAVENIVRSIMNTGDPVTGIEVAGQRADQTEERSWVTYWHPLRNSAGEIVGINVAAEEVTERKRAEAALRASERELRSARDAAEAALQHIKETQNFLIEAEKLAALGRLVAGVAHEINTPLGTSLTVASSLERKTAMIADELAQGNLKRSTLNEFLEISHAASSQLVANLNHAAETIQSFKQVATDRNYSNQRVFDLGDLTEQVIRSLRPGLVDQRVSLRVDCQPGLTMDSYPGPYGQVLTNLFLNSITHAFPDGTEGIVGVKAQASGDKNVEILFSDTGCGMSLDVRRKAFDPFFTTRRDQGCTGLGLHVVHTIITNCLGGRVNLESEPDQGTRITIVLPRVVPKAVALVMMARALIGGCLLTILMLRPDGAAAQTAAPPQDQDANTGNDLFRPPANLFQMLYGYKTAPGSGSAPGSTRDVTTETLNLRMDHSLDLAPLWILALRADVPLLAKNPVSSSNPEGDYLNGVGDADIQAVIIHNLDQRWTIGFGARLITPTGGRHVRLRKNGRSGPLPAFAMRCGRSIRRAISSRWSGTTSVSPAIRPGKISAICSSRRPSTSAFPTNGS